MYMNRKQWLDKWKERRAKMLAENRAGMSWNQLARRYHVTYGAIGAKLKKAKEEEQEAL